MATNAQGTRPTGHPNDTATVEGTPNPTVTSTGVGGVAVYDRDVDGTNNSTLRPAGTIHNDPAPVETRSGGSMLGWIIGVIVLIILAYFILQLIF